MALSIEAVRELYKKGEYVQVIEAAIAWEEENPSGPVGEYELWAAWSHHQLGTYDISVSMMVLLCGRYSADSKIGDSSRRGLAHGLTQLGKIEEAAEVLTQLQPSFAQENVRANIILQDARKGLPLPVLEVQQMLVRAMWVTPHEVVHGHIINNLTFALHEARGQEGVKPFRWILPGLIEMAMAMYQETGAAKNHQAGVLFRAATIFLATPGWERPALGIIEQSIALWEELVASQDGERYRRNLEGARELREKVLATLVPL